MLAQREQQIKKKSIDWFLGRERTLIVNWFNPFHATGLFTYLLKDQLHEICNLCRWEKQSLFFSLTYFGFDN